MIRFLYNGEGKFPLLKDEICIDRESLSEIIDEGDVISHRGILQPYRAGTYTAARELEIEKVRDPYKEQILISLNDKLKELPGRKCDMVGYQVESELIHSLQQQADEIDEAYFNNAKKSDRSFTQFVKDRPHLAQWMTADDMSEDVQLQMG